MKSEPANEVSPESRTGDGVEKAQEMNAVAEVGNKIGLEAADKVKIRRRLVKADSWPKFYRGLALLFNSGIQLDAAITELYKGAEDIGLRRALRKTSRALSHGKDLPRAFNESIPNFAPFNRELITVGMETGKLAVILDHLADYEETKQKMNLKLKSALTYPAFQTITALLVLFIAPAHFEASLLQTMDTLDRDLPLLLQLLFKLSWATNYAALCALAVTIILPLIWDSFQAFLAAEKTLAFGRKIRAKMMVFGSYVPGLKKALQAIAQERFTRALALQLDAGRPLVPSLRSAFRATDNPIFMMHEDAVVDGLMAGEPLEQLLRETGVFDEVSFLSFFKVSEESGLSSEVLQKSADFQAQSIDTNLASAMAALEPLLLMVVGLVIGAIIVSFFVPLVQLMQTL